MATFADLGIPSAALQLLEQRHITIPTPIQHQAIPPVMQGHDVIGLAQTGTGKTLAFVLPTVIKLVGRTGQCVILVPTRELAQQVIEVWQWFERSAKLPSALVIGGAAMGPQISALKRQPRCIVATPGRLIDLLKQRVTRLDQVNTVILDEADRMFDMGFAPQIKEILKQVPPIEQRQTLLFSATMPSSIVSLVRQNMRTPVSVEVAPSGTTAENIEQEFIVVEAGHKMTAIFELLENKSLTTLLFSRTKHGAKRITRTLRDRGLRAEEIHSNRSLYQRKQAMQAIQHKRSNILVATDIAARGIDIPHLDLVINYDLPEQAEDYVHRIGRVGRAGRTGKAVSLVQIDQGDLLRRIQRFVTKPMKQVHLKAVKSPELLQTSAPAGRRQFGGRRFSAKGGSAFGGGGRGSGGGRRRGFQRRRFS